MKRSGHLFEAIADRDNLRLAVLWALRGKRARPDARCYLTHLEANLDQLARGIRHHTVPVGRFRQFTIHDPKKRLITAPCFEERVLHHAILNVCEPHFERWLIHDSYACRRGKGRVACLLRAQAAARRYPVFLTLDIRKYFDSIDHAILRRLLAARFKDADLLALLGRILDGYAVSPGKGLPIGSLTSQHLANFYLGGADRFVKEVRRTPGYVRYMDDLALWGRTTAELSTTLAALTAYLGDTLGLSVKPNPVLNRTAHGMDFLGCRVLPSHLRLDARSRRRFVRKLRALDRAFQGGRLSEAHAQVQSQALIAFTRTAGVKAWRLRRRAIDLLTGEGHGPGPRAPRR